MCFKSLACAVALAGKQQQLVMRGYSFESKIQEQKVINCWATMEFNELVISLIVIGRSNSQDMKNAARLSSFVYQPTANPAIATRFPGEHRPFIHKWKIWSCTCIRYPPKTIRSACFQLSMAQNGVGKPQSCNDF